MATQGGAEHMKDDVQLNIASCVDEPPAPRTLRIMGKDGAELMWAEFHDPGWGTWKRVWRKITNADSAEDSDTVLIMACLKRWSLDKPITVDTLESLHLLIYQELAKAAMAVFEVRAGQLKNSAAP